jgi:hypothetical protein
MAAAPTIDAYTDHSFPDVPAHPDGGVDSFDEGCLVRNAEPPRRRTFKCLSRNGAGR